MDKAIGIFGYGYVAKALTEKMIAMGYQVHATSRNTQVKNGVDDKLYIYDFTERSIDAILSKCPNILISTPPYREGKHTHCDPFLVHFQDKLIKHEQTFSWIGYLSSTSVYGDHRGAWVYETSPSVNLKAHSLGHDRLMIEKAYLKYYEAHHLPIHIFRLAGIYGPGRCAIERIQQGKRHTIYEPKQYFSRVHIEDIVKTLIASIQKPMPGEVFNICDDKPSPSFEVDEFAAGLLNVPPPQRITLNEANLSQMGQEFYQNNKRVSNQKLKELLGIKLQYPSYQQGLKAIFKEM
tara:strand:+ start:1025 stop:1903 length:879 start_codon:yes stop_codon:yes gene_type:complete